jgi:hypothetical protein
MKDYKLKQRNLRASHVDLNFFHIFEQSLGRGYNFESTGFFRPQVDFAVNYNTFTQPFLTKTI